MKRGVQAGPVMSREVQARARQTRGGSCKKRRSQFLRGDANADRAGHTPKPRLGTYTLKREALPSQDRSALIFVLITATKSLGLSDSAKALS